MDVQTTLLQTLVDVLQNQIGDSFHILLYQRLEENDFIQTVQELRTEMTVKGFHNFLPYILRNVSIFRDTVQKRLGTDIGGQDNDGVLKVHRPSLRIGDSSVIQHL